MHNEPLIRSYPNSQPGWIERLKNIAARFSASGGAEKTTASAATPALPTAASRRLKPSTTRRKKSRRWFPAQCSAEKVIPSHTRRFGPHRLYSVFQPIFGLSHQRIVGYEALVRAQRFDAGKTTHVPPNELFDFARSGARIQELDALCRDVHIENFTASGLNDRWLFLNLDPTLLTDQRYRDGALLGRMQQSGLAFSRIVIEIVEGAITDEAVVRDAVDYFRGLGALVALDDFGAGHSNFDRIWRLKPDIIKLDRSLIVEAEQHGSHTLGRLFPDLVALMHEAGSLVLAEGIETEAQALLALDADVDFVQGFYFARPEREVAVEPIRPGRLEALTQCFIKNAIASGSEQQNRLQPYIEAFRDAVAQAPHADTLDHAFDALLDMPLTARCYVLDEYGEQIALRAAAGRANQRDGRFHPLFNTSGGNCFRRPYFRAARSEPGRLQVSRPYLSSVGTQLCITLSLFQDRDRRRVACCDLYG